MELPTAVKHALDAHADPDSPVYEVADIQPGDDDIRMVLLQEGADKLQVICRCRDLLDLSRLNQALKSSYRLVGKKEHQRLKQRLGVDSLPALPGLTGWPTVVDERVDRQDRVNLVVSPHGPRVTMPREAFQSLTSQARRLSVSVPVENIDVNDSDPERDLEQVHTAVQRFTGRRIQQRLEDTLELPPLPETAQRIIHLRVNPNALMGDLVDVVENDPSLAAQVVSWASSSFYAAAGQVRSVHDAVSRVLGFDLVMNLSMGLSLGRALHPPEDEPQGYIGYWQQAIWQAQAAGVLAAMMRRGERPSFGLSYLAGLLHNFGYLVLNQVFRPQFRLICRNIEANPQLDSSVIEHELLGVTREQLGAQLMENWGMPDEVNVALRYQKNPGYRGPNAVYARILWLSRQLLIERGIDMGVAQPVPDDLYDELGLNRDDVAEQFDLMLDKRDSILAMAGMMQSAT
ncbi:signal transduction protein [Tamilnaduibacter salinus]|uniref:Signal transduction protein n=1 Tax=Tamilnaduibacter salinus TaxID=1484056 RepID=A0A2A2I0T3_9GAMM|nr:HDOD domain-containing protein [Tamilnaduibacter salinus]PAV24906.1 signal transduction protein [Tamilnaduibacter salinus]